MRFSLQSLAICLVSTQTRHALASPCKPVTTTTGLAATTMTTAAEEASTTIAITDDSTTTSARDSIITAVKLSEDNNTNAVIVEPTSTFEATTTTAAETTTTTEALEGSHMSAVFSDNTVKDTYIGQYGGTYSSPQPGGSTSVSSYLPLCSVYT
ncbi:hypothetical protein H9Q69_009446 [Fusarium xylarioides]|nr:hypothetical protein H9Q69_009446 [Fusarium xylarioides]